MSFGYNCGRHALDKVLNGEDITIMNPVCIRPIPAREYAGRPDLAAHLLENLLILSA